MDPHDPLISSILKEHIGQLSMFNNQSTPSEEHVIAIAHLLVLNSIESHENWTL